MLSQRIMIDVPDGSSGSWRIETFAVSPRESELTLLRATVTGDLSEHVPAGTYKRLRRGGVVVMSNTPMEVATHLDFIRAARGRVLISGLGLGMALKAVLEKPDVVSVTVVERSPDVIALVAPTYLKDARVTVVQGDAFAPPIPADALFDVVWHDIWDDVCSANVAEMDVLEARYKHCAQWQRSWRRAECESMGKLLRKRAANVRAVFGM